MPDRGTRGGTDAVMKTYGFCLLIEGVPPTEEGLDVFANAIYEVATDSTVGVTRVGFDRHAASLRDAVASAIRDVRSAAPSVTIIGIELDDGQMLDDLLALGRSEPAGAGGK